MVLFFGGNSYGLSNDRPQNETPPGVPGASETFDFSLLTEIELLEESLVALHRSALQVVQKLTATRHKHQKPATGRMVFNVRLKVRCQLSDTLCQKSNLHISTARIFIVKAKRLNVRGFCHKSLF